MHTIRTYVVCLASGLCWLAGVGAVAAEAPSASAGAQSRPAAVCREAVVSPVSGYAECVKPRGAPVAPPPKRPDAVPAPSAVEAPHADNGH